jgi:hypothetical protein
MSDKVAEPKAIVAPATTEEPKTDKIVKRRLAVTELPVLKVVVHPLVLLSVVDHYNRMGKIGNKKRVVGILLGSFKGKGELDISNSFAGKSYF